MRNHLGGWGSFRLVVGLGEIIDAVLTRAVPDTSVCFLGRPPSLRGTVENLPEPSSPACKMSRASTLPSFLQFLIHPKNVGN